jgi:hypothetical protein
VMSELDASRRRRLVELLRAGGQSVITTTDLTHVPTAEDADVVRLAVANGSVLQGALGTVPALPASASQPDDRAAADSSEPGRRAGGHAPGERARSGRA